MFVFWTGRGALAFIIIIIAILPAAVGAGIGVAMLLPADTDFSDSNGMWSWAVFLWLVLSAAGIFLLARFGLKDTPRELIDPKTGQTVVLRRSDTLYGIEVKHYPLICAVGAVAALVWALAETFL